MSHADTEYRRQLLAISARLDQMLAEAEILLAEPCDVEIGCCAEDLWETIAEMSELVDEKLKHVAP
jgi:hypothetical protein